jgi:hypothetical protein
VSSKIQLSGKLGSSAKIESGASDLPLGSLPPLSANFFEITE